jgi:uridine kinase
MTQETLISRVMALRAASATVLVAIDGCGGAGKSFLAHSVAHALASAGTPATVVHVDDFFLPSAQRPCGPPAEKPVGGDFDWRRLRDQVLAPLRRGEPAQYERYDWSLDALAETHTLRPGQVVIVEGIYASRLEIAGLYDLLVWVECPRELRLTRGLARDGEHARGQWERDWMPAEDRYVAEHRPHERAHVVIDGTSGLQ